MIKLCRYGEAGKEKPAVVLEDDVRLDVSSFTKDYDEDFFENVGTQALEEWVEKNRSDLNQVDTSERWGSPLARPSKIICVGLNYAEHAAESGMEVPKEPVLFFKASSAIVGPYDNVMLPRGSEKSDWEVELALVISKKASYVEKQDAMDHVAGYVLHNDISERAFQLERGGQWVKGKSCDTFAPLGPYIVPADDVDDVHNLGLWLKLNGETVQDSSTSDFIFDIPELIHYISSFMTLLPGDIISTGTPQGVGLGFDPPKYLKVGDEMELGIDGLGVSKQKVIAAH